MSSSWWRLRLLSVCSSKTRRRIRKKCVKRRNRRLKKKYNISRKRKGDKNAKTLPRDVVLLLMSTRFVWKGLHLLNITFFSYFCLSERKWTCVYCILFFFEVASVYFVVCIGNTKWERERRIKGNNCEDNVAHFYEKLHRLWLCLPTLRELLCAWAKESRGIKKNVWILCVERKRGKHIGNSFCAIITFVVCTLTEVNKCCLLCLLLCLCCCCWVT